MKTILPNVGFLLRFLILAMFVFGFADPIRADESTLEAGHRLVAAVQDQDVLAEDLGDIPTVLSTLTSGTRFAGRANINKPIKESELNVYVLRRDLADQRTVPAVIVQSRILGNCAFIGVSNTIVCDLGFIDRFLTDHGVFNEVPNDSLQRARHEYQYAFLAWVLGHELGHVIAGGPSAHFGQADILDSKQKAEIELAQEAETAADLFAAKQIEADRPLTLALEKMLVSLVDQEVTEKNGKSPAYGVGLRWDYANKRVIQYFANQDHPEFVIRAARILTLVASDTNEESLKAAMETFTRHLVRVEIDKP